MSTAIIVGESVPDSSSFEQRKLPSRVTRPLLWQSKKEAKGGLFGIHGAMKSSLMLSICFTLCLFHIAVSCSPLNQWTALPRTRSLPCHPRKRAKVAYMVNSLGFSMAPRLGIHFCFRLMQVFLHLKDISIPLIFNTGATKNPGSSQRGAQPQVQSWVSLGGQGKGESVPNCSFYSWA